MCHRNETSHALDSTFPNTNCIFSFQINPHWISNSGFKKVVLETFQNGLENWWRESCFTRTMLLHSGSVVAMAAVCACSFELVDHPPYSPKISLFGTIWLFFVPQHRTDDEVTGIVCRIWGLFRGSGWELLYHRNSSAATSMEDMCGLQGRLCWKIIHIWSKSTIASNIPFTNSIMRIKKKKKKFWS